MDIQQNILYEIEFEGYYLNRKRNGEGREYEVTREEFGCEDKQQVSRLIFNGNYDNNKRNGKGKEYNCK